MNKSTTQRCGMCNLNVELEDSMDRRLMAFLFSYMDVLDVFRAHSVCRFWKESIDSIPSNSRFWFHATFQMAIHYFGDHRKEKVMLMRSRYERQRKDIIESVDWKAETYRIYHQLIYYRLMYVDYSTGVISSEPVNGITVVYCTPSRCYSRRSGLDDVLSWSRTVQERLFWISVYERNGLLGTRVGEVETIKPLGPKEERLPRLFSCPFPYIRDFWYIEEIFYYSSTDPIVCRRCGTFQTPTILGHHECR